MAWLLGELVLVCGLLDLLRILVLSLGDTIEFFSLLLLALLGDIGIGFLLIGEKLRK